MITKTMYYQSKIICCGETDASLLEKNDISNTLI